MTKVNVSHCYRPILWHSQAAVSKLEALAEADDYDTTVNATLLGKYTAHKDSYIADCITKICAMRQQVHQPGQPHCVALLNPIL